MSPPALAVSPKPEASKSVSPLVDLQGGQGEGEIRVMANYTFTGREVGTDRTQEFNASIQVAFADWGDI